MSASKSVQDELSRGTAHFADFMARCMAEISNTRACAAQVGQRIELARSATAGSETDLGELLDLEHSRQASVACK